MRNFKLNQKYVWNEDGKSNTDEDGHNDHEDDDDEFEDDNKHMPCSSDRLEMKCQAIVYGMYSM